MKSTPAWLTLIRYFALITLPSAGLGLLIFWKLVIPNHAKTGMWKGDDLTGSILLISCGFIALLFVLPHFLTVFHEDYIAQPNIFGRKKIYWNDLTKMRLTGEAVFIFHSNYKRIQVNCLAYGDSFLKEALHFPGIDKAKHTMAPDEWAYIAEMREIFPLRQPLEESDC